MSLSQVVARAPFSPSTRTPLPATRTQAVPPKPKLQALTALRFFAAAMIVMLHAQGYFGAVPLLGHFVLTQGVCFFFVLSGFILTCAYPSLDRRGAARFLVARLARIVPLHLVALLLYVLILPAWYRDAVSSSTRGAGVLTALLMQAWVPLYRVQTAFNGVSWSLSAELFFYLCFPLLLWRWRQMWRVKLAATLLLAVGTVFVANHGMGLLPRGAEVRDVVYLHPLARVWEFALGVATAHLWRFVHPRLRPRRWVGTVLELAVCGGTLAVMAESGAWARAAGRHALVGPGGEAWLASSGLCCLPFAALIGIMACEWGGVSRVLSHPVLVMLGEISFSLYLLHLLFCHYYVLHPGPFVAVPPWLVFLGYWGVVLLAAYVGWFVVEVPCRRAIVGWWDRAVMHRPARRAATKPATPWFGRAALWGRAAASGVLLLTLTGIQIAARAAPPAGTDALQSAPEGAPALVTVDAIGTQSAAGDTPVTIARADYPSGAVEIVGWSVDPADHGPVRGVLVSVDDRAGTWAEYGSSRNDVSAFLGSAAYLHSGFVGAIPLKGLASGTHTVTVKAIMQGGAAYAETRETVRIT